MPRPKTTRQHHKVRELNYQFNLDSALNMKRAKSLEQVGSDKNCPIGWDGIKVE